MSTDSSALGQVAAESARALQTQLATQQSDLEQQNLFDPVTPDDLLEAREELGPDAGNVAVLAHARLRRQGRPKGSKNRRNADLERYLRTLGPDPLANAYVIATTNPLVLIENSRRSVKRMTKNGGIIEIEESMSYAEAMAVIARYSEMVLPYVHQKKPVQVDATIRHDGDLIIAGTTHSVAETRNIIDAEFADLDSFKPDFGDDDEEAA